MELSNEQLQRYSRQTSLHGIGSNGQQKLLESRVLVVGAGGLGSPAALYLAAAGIGTLGLVDADVVELSNLQRQILHNFYDVGKPKVFSGKEKISLLNSDVSVVTYHEKIAASNIDDIIMDKNYQFIIDATDNFPTKFLINDACVMNKKPFSHGGISGFQGQTMTYIPENGPCYRCIFHHPPETAFIQTGVLGAVAGIIGTIQAIEAIKYLLGIGRLLNGCLLTYDALHADFRKIKLKRRQNCPVCGNTAEP